MSQDGGTFGRAALSATRVWLPLGIAMVGAALVAVGSAKGSLAAAGVVLMGVALIVWMINWMFRMSVESNRERDAEEAARRYFDEHGRWPGE